MKLKWMRTSEHDQPDGIKVGIGDAPSQREEDLPDRHWSRAQAGGAGGEWEAQYLKTMKWSVEWELKAKA